MPRVSILLMVRGSLLRTRTRTRCLKSLLFNGFFSLCHRVLHTNNYHPAIFAYWLLWDKSTVVDTAQPGWRGVNSSSKQVNKPVECRCKVY